ncbi:MAG TPA: K(+)-transporting ATPase subunit B [Gemmatimonadetes bacterium]|nr:K(+)-transporting ATPase subunit B [Gemmatimonadota bacterium]
MQQQSTATRSSAAGTASRNPAPGSTVMTGGGLPGHPRPSRGMMSPELVKPAIVDAFRKLNPRDQLRNPVMFVVYAGSILTSILCVRAWLHPTPGGESAGFILAVTVWLWFTVLFANFAEALAEGRSKQQAAALRGLKTTTMARVVRAGYRDARDARAQGATEQRAATELRKGDVVLVEAGDMIPGDGEVIEGVASVDESAITGESAPVIRESGGDFSSVTGGTRVLSDWIIVRITANPGESFIDRMISMVEGAKRQKTPNELALTILLVGLTLVLLLATATLQPYSLYAVLVAKAGVPVSVTVLVALLVCLIPTTIGGLLSAIGVAGMSRMMEANVIATSGRAVEAAGDVDVLLLDKTGTITRGEPVVRCVTAIDGDEATLLRVAASAELRSEHPLAEAVLDEARRRELTISEPEQFEARAGRGVTATVDGLGILVGTRAFLEEQGVETSSLADAAAHVESDAQTPLWVATERSVLGLIAVADALKEGSREAVRELQDAGLRVVMLTGDREATARAIAAEVGITDVRAELLPEHKVAAIRELQEDFVVAMVGDGINDAPALAQADVGIAIGTGTDVAMETANVTLMRGDLRSVPVAFALSRATMRTIKQNLFWAFFYNVVLIPVAAGALYSLAFLPMMLRALHPILAAFAMAFSSVSVVGNSLRLRRARL